MSLLKSSIKGHENRVLRAYPDKVRQPDGSMKTMATSVGYGYNMTDNPTNAKKEFKSVGADYDKVLSGQKDLTEEQADKLFDISFNRAQADAKRFLPKLSEHPENVQRSIIEMSYQMGGPTLAKFKKTKKFLQDKEYDKAAEEMLDSAWARQTPERAKALSQQVRGDDPTPARGESQETAVDNAAWSNKADSMFGDLGKESKATTAGHRVARGETLSGIAKKNGMDWRELARINGLSDPDMIDVGQELKFTEADSSPSSEPAPDAGPQPTYKGEEIPTDPAKFSEMFNRIAQAPAEEPIPDMPEPEYDEFSRRDVKTRRVRPL